MIGKYNFHLAIIFISVSLKERFIINANLTKLWERYFCLPFIFSSVMRGSRDNQDKLYHLKKLPYPLCKSITKLLEVEKMQRISFFFFNFFYSIEYVDISDSNHIQFYIFYLEPFCSIMSTAAGLNCQKSYILTNEKIP